MNGLKALVIFLGVLIVVGMTVLVWGIYKKSQDPDFNPFSSSTPATETGALPSPGPATALRPAPAGEALRPFGTLPVSLGPGCRVEDVRPDGRLLHLRVGPAGGSCDKIVVIDLAQGRRLGEIELRH